MECDNNHTVCESVNQNTDLESAMKEDKELRYLVPFDSRGA